MTAEVAVMNAQGVAIAADSAVTITLDDNNSKTYYTSQKIFSLSKMHSVGIMIYSNAYFMGIDWEILIAEYNKAVGDRVFDTLEEYAKYFLAFLSNFIHITDALQKECFGLICKDYFDTIKQHYDKEILENYKNKKITKAQQNIILAEILKKIRVQLENDTYTTNCNNWDFISPNESIIAENYEKAFSDFNITKKLKDEMWYLLMSDIDKLGVSSFLLENNTGIVFAGYGSKEIYPSVIEFSLFARLGNNVLHSDFNKSDMSESNAWINPYAQHDVINTFVRGIDPYLREGIEEEMEELMNKVIGIVGKNNKTKIDKLKKEFIEHIDEVIEEAYKGPIMRIVGSLPKSDLAEMAEALVNLTSLRRHMSTDRETVGGPTDVALITKMDGFVWIKKKQTIQSLQETKI